MLNFLNGSVQTKYQYICHKLEKDRRISFVSLEGTDFVFLLENFYTFFFYSGSDRVGDIILKMRFILNP